MITCITQCVRERESVCVRVCDSEVLTASCDPAGSVCLSVSVEGVPRNR